MTEDTIHIKKLTPSDGMFLTDGETIADGPVYLGINDSPDNWHEITLEEKDSIEAEEIAKAKECEGLDNALVTEHRT